jgi:AcrR family transcriptional regulator
MKEKPAQGPRGLAKDTIVAAALALLEEVGETAFSVRKLAQTIGCDPMSVLYHFKSKEGLSRAMANALSRSLTRVDETLPWPTRLRELARQYRMLALAHPNAFGLLQRYVSTGPADLEHVETVHRALLDAGIARTMLPCVCVGWYASVIGLAAAEVGGLTRPANEVELAEMEALSEAGHPLVRAAAPLYGQLDPAAVHDTMLDILLDGIAHQAAQPARRRNNEQGRPIGRPWPVDGGKPRSAPRRGADRLHHPIDDLLRRQFDADFDRLVRARRLERVELALQQRRIEEMAGAGLQAFVQHLERTLQVHESHVGVVAAQDVAVRALERRARKHRRLARAPLLLDGRADRIQPRPAIFVGQRNAAMHLVLVGGAVKRIAVGIGARQALRQHLADPRLARARHAHCDQNH